MKKYLWAFVVSICVFLVCTFYVTRRVEVVEDRAALEAHPHEFLPPHATAHPAPESPPKSAVKSAAPATSIVAVIQALSGLIAAITGLLGVIKGFRRAPVITPTTDKQ